MSQLMLIYEWFNMSKTKAPSSKRKVKSKSRINREKAKHTRRRQELSEEWNRRHRINKRNPVEDDEFKKFVERFERTGRFGR